MWRFRALITDTEGHTREPVSAKSLGVDRTARGLFCMRNRIDFLFDAEEKLEQNACYF